MIKKLYEKPEMVEIKLNMESNILDMSMSFGGDIYEPDDDEIIPED